MFWPNSWSFDVENASATAELVRAEGRRAETYATDVSQRASVESAVHAYTRALDDIFHRLAADLRKTTETATR